MRFMGMDIAMNHSAFVQLDERGNLTWWHYVLDQPTKIKGKAMFPASGSGTLLKISKSGDKSQDNLRRLVFWQNHMSSIVNGLRPDFVGIEDYALMTQSGAHLKGEVGGLARFYATKHGKLRLHEPTSIKMYIAHNGAAKPETVAAAVEERWPMFQEAWAGQSELARLDLAVAGGIAQMVLAEHRLRSGQMKLSDFHEKEIQVWNRATKSYPVNLLSRDWITR